MERLIESGKDKNTREHYNGIFLERLRNEGFDMNQPLRMEKLLAKFHGGRFLEIGCGVAPHCMNIKTAFPDSEVWAIDIADKMIEELRQINPKINYVSGTIYDLPFRDNFFDNVIIGEVLEHMENPQFVLGEINRILKPEGYIALSTPLRDDGLIAPKEHIWSFEEKDIRDLLSEKFRHIETEILYETNHHYIIGYGEK